MLTSIFLNFPLFLDGSFDRIMILDRNNILPSPLYKNYIIFASSIGSYFEAITTNLQNVLYNRQTR